MERDGVKRRQADCSIYIRLFVTKTEYSTQQR